MNALPLLDTRAGFVLAALAVTLVAVALIAVVLANMHARLLRLEQASPATRTPDPYARLSGTPLDQLLLADSGATPRAVVVMSPGCRACERVLQELRQRPPQARIALVWSDSPPPSVERLPANITVRHGDVNLRTRIGTGVTPFALVIGDDAVVVKAFPLSNLDLLIRALNGSAPPRTSARATAL